MIIESIDEWNDLVKTLLEFDYERWETQYGINEPEGFCARFVSGKSVVDVATHNKEVYRAIIKYGEI